MEEISTEMLILNLSLKGHVVKNDHWFLIRHAMFQWLLKHVSQTVKINNTQAKQPVFWQEKEREIFCKPVKVKYVTTLILNVLFGAENPMYYVIL